MMMTLFLSIAFAAQVHDVPNTVISEPRQITFTGPRACEGYFSADGRRMIFQSEREPGNPFYQMYVMDLRSGALKRVSTGQGQTTCGWIHPSGRKVMWSSTHLDPKKSEKEKAELEQRASKVQKRYAWNYDENYDIFESDLNGGHVRRLTREKGYDAEGSYSPDGKWIAFASNRAAYDGTMSAEDAAVFAKDASYMMDIYIMKSDGTGVKRLTATPGYDGGPFFSADGKKITWRRFAPNGMTAEIYTMNADGGDPKAVTRLGAMSWAPFFHPSGDYIVFTSSVFGHANFELFIVDAAGAKDPVRVTFADGFDGLPTFSPDGGQISWTKRNETGASQIYMARWDDAQARKLLGLPAREPGPDLAAEIREADAREWVGWLASEKMNGRPTGGEEEKQWTEKAAALFKSWGLVGGAPDGTFFHRFSFTSKVSLGAGNRLVFDGAFKRDLKIGTDAEPYSLSGSGVTPAAPVVFAGYGLKAPAAEGQAEYDSYKDLDVKGKWALVWRDLPDEESGPRRQYLNTYARLQHKVTVAREAGAVGLLVMENEKPLQPLSGNALRFEGSLSASSLPVWRLSGPWLKEFLKKAAQTTAAATTDLVQEKSNAVNVIARLKGADAKLPAVLVGAHADHLGRGQAGSSLARSSEQGQVHFGADDNASGVAAVMEIAHKLADEKRRSPRALRKDVVFALWSAEEIGVLGSKAFAHDWSEKRGDFKKSFTAALNLDMVGRLRDRLQVQGVGSGDNWSRLAEEVALRTGLPVSVTEDPYLPSDSLSFYLAGVPAIGFFTGSHGEYHSPRDTAETLNYPGLVRTAEFAAAFARLLADSPVKMVSYRAVKGDPNSHLAGRTFRVHLGTIPDYAQEGIKGVLLSGVTPDSPAAQAGLKEKDVIVAFGPTKIENLYDYVYALQSAKAGEQTTVRIRRGERELELKIIPQLK